MPTRRHTLFGYILSFHLLLLIVLSGCSGLVDKSSTPPQQSQAIAHVSSLTPASFVAGSGAVQIKVSGSNFDSTSSVLWNTTALQTTYINSGSLTASISASDLAQPGTATIAVTYGKSSTVSNGMPLTITAGVTPLKISTTSLPGGQVSEAYQGSIAASGGTAPYNWSVSSGILPNGLTLNASSGAISGQPSTAGTANFTIAVQDSSASKSTAKAQLSIQIAAAPNPPAPPSGSTSYSYYGSGIGSDGLGNTTLGPNQNKVSYRIRMEHSGFISSVQPYLIMDHDGYWGGTGGSVLVSIQTDDGTSEHNPSGQKLTSSLLTNPDSVPVPTRYFPTFSFSGHASVSAGVIYHVVFENTDSNPSVNFVSVDSLYQAAAPKPSQPTMSDTDCAVLLFSNFNVGGLTWKPRQGYTPVLQVNFDDGFTQGLGYMEVWVGTPENISGSSSVREAFTMSGTSKSVSSVGARVARISGTGALTIRLESSDGTLIEQGTVASSALPLSSTPQYVWATFKFSSTHTLVVGQSYHLVLQAPSSTIYQTFPIRKGSDYGFDSATFFTDGYAQFLDSGTWVGWTQWGVANRTDGDLQFYLLP